MPQESRFLTIAEAAEIVALPEPDLRARLEAAVSVFVSGHLLNRRGSDLVEVKPAAPRVRP